MRVDYEKVFKAFRKCIDRPFYEMLRSDTLRKERKLLFEGRQNSCGLYGEHW